jgi:hypothetical protein
MISHKHQCIFVHIPKAAGTSIERAFMNDLGLDMDNRHSLFLGKNTNLSFGPRVVSHLLAKEYVEQHYISQELFDSYFKFAIIRHPVERLFSSYKYRKYDDYLSFDSYIKIVLIKLVNSKTESFFYKPQYDYLYSSDGILLVDYIGKFEDLKKEFGIIKHKVSCNQLTLRHYNKSGSTKGIYRKIRIIGKLIKNIHLVHKFSFFNNKNQILSNEAKEIIWNYYKKDFESFNYEF